jgi:hypothetical protein
LKGLREAQKSTIRHNGILLSARPEFCFHKIFLIKIVIEKYAGRTIFCNLYPFHLEPIDRFSKDTLPEPDVTEEDKFDN